MSRPQSARVDAFNFIITAMIGVVAVMVATMLAITFQTLPTATNPIQMTEISHER